MFVQITALSNLCEVMSCSLRYEALAGFLSRDIIDREIGQICERLPQILEDNTIIRKAQGRYRINGREVSISLVTREAKEEENWIDSGIPSKCPTSNILDIIEEVNEVTATPFEANHEDLVVRDGPLTQPFLDYVFDTGLGFLMTNCKYISLVILNLRKGRIKGMVYILICTY